MQTRAYVMGALIFSVSAMSFGAPLKIEEQAYSKERILSSPVHSLKAETLLNSFDLDNRDAEKNIMIINYLEILGEQTRSKIAKLYFFNELFTDEKFPLNEDEIFSLHLIDTANSKSYKYMHDKVIEKIIGKTIGELDQIFINSFTFITPPQAPEQDGHIYRNPYLGGSDFLNSPDLRLNDVALSHSIKRISEIAPGSAYYLAEKKHSINTIVKNSNQIITQTSLRGFSLKAPKFKGSYSVNASGKEKKNVTFNNVDQTNVGHSAWFKPAFGTKGTSDSAVYVNSKKYRKTPEPMSFFFLSPSFESEKVEEKVGKILERKAFDFTQQEEFKLSYEFLNVGLATLLKARGGYSCKNRAGVKTDCKDYTSTSSATISGVISLPVCEDIYTCLPVMEVMPFSSNALTMSIPKDTNTKFLLSSEREVKITFTDTASHTGQSKSIEHQQQSTSIRVWAPVTFISHSFDFLTKTALAMNFIKDDIIYANIIADMAQKAKERTKRFPHLKTEEEVFLYTILRFMSEPNYKHSDESRIVFRIIEDSIKNRLVELNFSTLQNEINISAQNYKNNLSYHLKTTNILTTLLNREETTQEDIRALALLIQELTGQNLDINQLDEINIKEAITVLIQQENNRLFIERTYLEDKINEFKLYGGSSDFLEFIN